MDHRVPDLTPAQTNILAIIEAAMEDTGYPPTVRQIQDKMQLASTSTVHKHLVALEKAGMITRGEDGRRLIRVVKS